MILYTDMSRLQQRKIKQNLYSWWSMILLLLLAILFVRATWNVYLKYHASRMNLLSLEERQEAILQREIELRAKITDLESEEGLEKEIREKFSVVKEGEKVLIITGKDEEVVIVPQEKSFFRSTTSWIKDLFR